jgi:hypothetical protein
VAALLRLALDIGGLGADCRALISPWKVGAPMEHREGREEGPVILFRSERGDRLQRDSERHKPISSVTPADGLGLALKGMTRGRLVSDDSDGRARSLRKKIHLIRVRR